MAKSRTKKKFDDAEGVLDEYANKQNWSAKQRWSGRTQLSEAREKEMANLKDDNKLQQAMRYFLPHEVGANPETGTITDDLILSHAVGRIGGAAVPPTVIAGLVLGSDNG